MGKKKKTAKRSRREERANLLHLPFLFFFFNFFDFFDFAVKILSPPPIKMLPLDRPLFSRGVSVLCSGRKWKIQPPSAGLLPRAGKP
jgi:hypothetical protein